jgi:tripeptide aminopeptidase
MDPEKGINAIHAASRAICALRLGRLDPETTANVGLVSGGTAPNIVPEWCEVTAEARSHDEAKLGDLVQEMLDAFTFGANATEVEVQTEVRRTYRAYRFRRDEPVVRLAAEALGRCGIEPTYSLSGGAADANVFNERGLACVNLANGMTDIHTPNEHIAVADLERMVDVTLALCDAALA